MDYHQIFWKSELLDFIIFQQDAFDDIDQMCPMERQQVMLKMVMDICRADFEFDEFGEISVYFKNIINIMKQMNYSEFKSEQFEGYVKQLDELVQQRKRPTHVA